MIKKQFIFIALLLFAFSLSAATVMADEKGQQKSSPFLITGKLPHLTKLLMKQWDNPELKLSEAQKAKLLVVRKATISGAQNLGKEINALEFEVVEGSKNGKKPEELRSIVRKIEKLKGEATMLHLSCIYNTSNILNAQQLTLLTK